MTRTQLFLALTALVGPCQGDPGPDVTVCHQGSPLTLPERASTAHLDHGDTLVEPETCDGVDQDCDGAVDEGASDGVEWFADADGDGFGDPSVGVVACAAPEGHVADATDCDDGDPSVYPGAPELCDGLVQDCDALPGAGDGDGTFVVGGRTSWGGPLSSNPSMQTFRSLLSADSVHDLEALDAVSLAPLDLLFLNAWEWAATESEVTALEQWVDGGGTLLVNAAGGYSGNSDGWVAPWSIATAGTPTYWNAWPVWAPSDPDSAALVDGLSLFTNKDATPLVPVGGTFGDAGVEVLAATDEGSVVLAHVPNSGAGQVLAITNFWAFHDAASGGYIDEPDNHALVEHLVASARDGGSPTLEVDADADGWFSCGGDCDDGDPSVHPGAPEACDGLDHDCDGLPTVCEGDGEFVLGGRLSFGGPLSTNAALTTFRALIAPDVVVDLGALDGTTLAEVDLLFVNAWEAPPTGPEVDAVVAWVEDGGTLLLNAAGGYGGNSDGWIAPWSMATMELPWYSGTWPFSAPLHPESVVLVAGLSTFTNTTATPVYPLTGAWSDGGVEVLSSAGGAVLVHVPDAGAGQVMVVTSFWAFMDGGHVLEVDNSTLVQRLAQSARDGG